ncbi:hypothetical protein TNCV_813221 [Trichonephila clavipes]|nr:hypothetical protein TNCV_813221 [Trichonephila clavipes]
MFKLNALPDNGVIECGTTRRDASSVMLLPRVPQNGHLKREAFSFGRPDCKNSPQSHIMRVYDAGLGKSGVFHSAEWHVGDWLSDGIREAWLMFFIWVVSFKEFFGLTELRGCSLIGCRVQ